MVWYIMVYHGITEYKMTEGRACTVLLSTLRPRAGDQLSAVQRTTVEFLSCSWLLEPLTSQNMSSLIQQTVKL